MVDVDYDLRDVRLAASNNPYARFAGLLPVATLRERLPAAVYTPLIHATRLGRELGLSKLYLKNETVLPTRTTKDRMAAVALAYLAERGVTRFCASSTGNSSTAFAYAIRAHPEMQVTLFSGEAFVPRVQHAGHPQVTHFGLRGATFVEAGDYAATYAREHGLTAESGFFNPGRREGLKLTFLEACDQLAEPVDWYVQAVSSAMGVYGTYKGARQLLALGRLSRMPRLMCVQQASCAPMVRAFRDGSETIRPEHRVERPTGIAEAILRGDPSRAYPHVRRIVLECGGTFVAVAESRIREARAALEACEGVDACFSAAAAVAAVIERARAKAIDSGDVVVINVTGADRDDAPEMPDVRWIDTLGWNSTVPARAVQGTR